jgi:RHS repeat-associated protein
VGDATTINGQPSAHAACYDGNGNVTALVNFSDASLSARYEYGPFGEPIRLTGAIADANPFRFSTKFSDDETGNLDYGYRLYMPPLGRWASMDPIEEQGGRNLYAFCLNSPLSCADLYGLLPVNWLWTDPGDGAYIKGHYGRTDAIIDVTVDVKWIPGCRVELKSFGRGFAPYVWGSLKIKAHEQIHVGHVKHIFESYASAAVAYDGEYRNPAKADCYASLIANEMRAYYVYRSEELAQQLECDTYPRGLTRDKACADAKVARAAALKWAGLWGQKLNDCLCMQDY